jgi:hypothetical protein
MPRNPRLGPTTTALALFAVLGLSSAVDAAEPQTPATPDQQSGCTMRDGVAIGAGCGSSGATADQGGVPGQAGKLGTSATGGAPGATAASGTQGGPPPDRSKPTGGSTEGQGVEAMAGKAGSGATGGGHAGRLPARRGATVRRTGWRSAGSGGGYPVDMLSGLAASRA